MKIQREKRDRNYSENSRFYHKKYCSARVFIEPKSIKVQCLVACQQRKIATITNLKPTRAQLSLKDHPKQTQNATNSNSKTIPHQAANKFTPTLPKFELANEFVSLGHPCSIKSYETKFQSRILKVGSKLPTLQKQDPESRIQTTNTAKVGS